jgi:2,3-bisphosphoglycerate-dependent phosphoglycerate mutase
MVKERNPKNLFTGWRDVDITEAGIAEARAAGRNSKRKICNSTSASHRRSNVPSAHSISCLKAGPKNIPVIKNQALNERDYANFRGSTRTMRVRNGDRESPYLASFL